RRDRLREAVSINTTVMAGTSAGMTRGSRLARLPQEVDQVELRRLDAGMAEQAVHLAAMMGLAIEEMRQRREERIGEFVAPHVAVGEASRQRGGIEAVGEGDDLRVLGLAGGAERGEILVQDHVQPGQMRRHRSREAAEPDAVADQDV